MAEPTEDPTRPTTVNGVVALYVSRIVVDMLATMDNDTYTKLMQNINDARAEVQRIRDEEYPVLGDGDPELLTKVVR